MGKNSSTYRRAAALLMERFPALGLRIGTWERKEAIEEDLPPLKGEKAELVYVYGLGTGSGYFQYRSWLKEKPERTLVFIEREGGVIASFLQQPYASEILADPQVHLEFFTGKSLELQALAEKFPMQRVEVIASSSYRNSSFWKVRLQLFRKTALSHALHLDRLHGYQPFQNFVENLRHLPRSFYANRLRGAFSNVPAIVCGAGPSLQKSLEVLRTLEQRALIIAGGSTLAALSSQGIAPHFGMAVDPNLEEYRRLKNSFAFEVPLLYSTRVHPAVFQTCNGPFGYMRSGIGGIPELWMEEGLGFLEPFIGEFLSPESISVTSICVAWAHYLGCNPILLNGVDMAYTENRHYAAGVTDEGETPLEAIEAEASAADRILKRKDRAGRPIYTAVRWIMESACISNFAKKCPEVRFINTTEGGIGFQEIEYLPLADAVANWKERNLRKEIHEKIIANPMPSGEKIDEKMAELRASLHRLIDHLEVLAGEKKGSAALAEFELQEEIAALYLFYDIRELFKPPIWKPWLELARKYRVVLG